MGSQLSLRAPGPRAGPAWLEVLLSNPGKAPDLLLWLNSNCQATLPWACLAQLPSATPATQHLHKDTTAIPQMR